MPPLTIGEELPAPGISARHRRFWESRLQLSGKAAAAKLRRSLFHQRWRTVHLADVGLDYRGTHAKLLDGVGPAIANAIVQERETGGRFESVEALERVHGIGPATVERLRPFVTARAAD